MNTNGIDSDLATMTAEQLRAEVSALRRRVVCAIDMLAMVEAKLPYVSDRGNRGVAREISLMKSFTKEVLDTYGGEIATNARRRLAHANRPPRERGENTSRYVR